MPFNAFERLLAWRYLRSRRKEGFISVIAGFSLMGIMLGVATLIIVMAVMNGFRAELLGRILGINAHMSVSRYGQPMTDYDALVEKLKTIPGVKYAAPVIEGQVMATANGSSTGAVVKVMRDKDLMARTMVSTKIVEGNINEFHGLDTVIIGARMARSMGLRVGDYITLIAPKTTETFVGVVPRLKEYRVIALFDVGMYEYDSGYVFMPLEAGQLYFKSPDAVNLIELMVNDPNHTDEVAKKIETMFQREYIVSDWKQMNVHFFNSLQVERNVMFLILALIIVVAAFNIISSMIMLVKDKARAIAIMRTMGASRGSVMRIFFLCGSSIGVMGTFLGFVLGLTFSLNIDTIKRALEKLTNTELFSAEIYFLSKLPAEVQADDVIAVVGMALVLSFLATLYPAWRAANISPAEGVRGE
ncbi:MAG: lipoprotein-releasing ABC transporter permease subunit [Proteobacteria bacterium]|nr:lipoprotein-releasing ABC transporter permease subunit [Pseudomonadota bacterium]